MRSKSKRAALAPFNSSPCQGLSPCKTHETCPKSGRKGWMHGLLQQHELRVMGVRARALLRILRPPSLSLSHTPSLVVSPVTHARRGLLLSHCYPRAARPCAELGSDTTGMIRTAPPLVFAVQSAEVRPSTSQAAVFDIYISGYRRIMQRDKAPLYFS